MGKEVKKFMLLKKIPGDPQTRFYVSQCKYCGRLFIKFQNKTTLCSYKCKVKSSQDSKAKYQRKRRKAINDGTLIANEKQLGTSTVLLSKKPKATFEEEHYVILQEKRRVGILSQ